MSDDRNQMHSVNQMRADKASALGLLGHHPAEIRSVRDDWDMRARAIQLAEPAYLPPHLCKSEHCK